MAIQPTPRNIQRSKFRLLRQTSSGAIFAWNPVLAKRPDMVEWKHPTREVGSKGGTKQTPDEIKLESVAQQEEQEPTIAEMAKAVLAKSKKSKTEE